MGAAPSNQNNLRSKKLFSSEPEYPAADGDTGKLVRHGSDGNPSIWINIGQSGNHVVGKPVFRLQKGLASRRSRMSDELKELNQEIAAGECPVETHVERILAECPER